MLCTWASFNKTEIWITNKFPWQIAGVYSTTNTSSHPHSFTFLRSLQNWKIGVVVGLGGWMRMQDKDFGFWACHFFLPLLFCKYLSWFPFGILLSLFQQCTAICLYIEGICRVKPQGTTLQSGRYQLLYSLAGAPLLSQWWFPVPCNSSENEWGIACIILKCYSCTTEAITQELWLAL